MARVVFKRARSLHEWNKNKIETWLSSHSLFSLKGLAQPSSTLSLSSILMTTPIFEKPGNFEAVSIDMSLLPWLKPFLESGPLALKEARDLKRQGVQSASYHAGADNVKVIFDSREIASKLFREGVILRGVYDINIAHSFIMESKGLTSFKRMPLDRLVSMYGKGVPSENPEISQDDTDPIEPQTVQGIQECIAVASAADQMNKELQGRGGVPAIVAHSRLHAYNFTRLNSRVSGKVGKGSVIDGMVDRIEEDAAYFATNIEGLIAVASKQVKVEGRDSIRRWLSDLKLGEILNLSVSAESECGRYLSVSLPGEEGGKGTAYRCERDGRLKYLAADAPKNSKQAEGSKSNSSGGSVHSIFSNMSKHSTPKVTRR